MKRDLNKLTLEIRKQLKEIAETLPKTAYLTATGQTMAKTVTRVVKGKETGLEEINGKTVIAEDLYTQKGKQIVTVNHLVNLRTEYQKRGFNGVEMYVNHVLEVTKN